MLLKITRDEQPEFKADFERLLSLHLGERNQILDSEKDLFCDKVGILHRLLVDPGEVADEEIGQ